MAIGGGVNMRWHLVFWLCSALIGCAYFDSWEESNGGAVGRPWEEIAKLWGPEDQTWIRDDGKTIYRYHLKRLDPSCVHYWVVDEQGVIVDFYYDGYCRPIG